MNFDRRFLLASIFSAVLSCKKDSAPVSNTPLSLLSASLNGKSSFNFSNASVTPQVVLIFSQPIDHSSSSSFLFSGGAVSVSYTHHDSVVTVQPTTALHYFTAYTLQVLPTVKSISQKQLGGNAIFISVNTQVDPTPKFPTISDDALLDLVQQQTIKYFYDFGHPDCGMARERNTSGDIVTTGGSGFGLMAMIVGINRGFIPRADGIARFKKIISFLETADRFHGAWPHWLDGHTGKVIPFSTNDNGADIVETSYMAQGLLTLRQYLTSTDTVGNNLINRITNLYNAVEWDWFRNGNQNVLYWHWSPDKAWIMNFPLSGYFEEQITYLMAASSPTHGIPKIVYSNGFGQNGAIATNKTFTYNGQSYVLPLGSPSPLFWVQYSYLGLNPHFSDDYANYRTQNVNATLLNYNYCVQNPKNFADYGTNCWGLTAGDNQTGYDAQSPANDNGTISPTAALSSFPYTPTQSMQALHFFYYTLGDRLWGPYGFYDAFRISTAWCATSTLAIDQGPIVIMIENYRTGLLWNLFESASEVKVGKAVLGFK